MTTRTTIYALFVVAAAATATQLASAQQADDQVTVAWSDPSRPGLVEIESLSGGMAIKGSNRTDVLVIGRQRGVDRRVTSAQQGGLRRLTQSGGFSVEEERNVMQVESQSFNKTIDFEVLVPLRTNLKIEALNNAFITVDNVEGDMELKNVNGPITLTNVSGSVVADALNSAIKATFVRLSGSRPMAFTSLNGVIDVTLPAAAKATLKLRSDMGDVFTDFDIQLTQGAAPRTRDTRRNGGGRFEIEVNKAIHGTINGGGPEIEMRTFNGSVYVRKGQ